MTMIIHRYGSDGAWAETRKIGDDDGIPYGWTGRALPNLQDGERAVWGAGNWVSAPIPAPVVGQPAPEPQTDRLDEMVTEGVITDREAEIIRALRG